VTISVSLAHSAAASAARTLDALTTPAEPSGPTHRIARRCRVPSPDGSDVVGEMQAMILTEILAAIDTAVQTWPTWPKLAATNATGCPPVAVADAQDIGAALGAMRVRAVAANGYLHHLFAARDDVGHVGVLPSHKHLPGRWQDPDAALVVADGGVSLYLSPWQVTSDEISVTVAISYQVVDIDPDKVLRLVRAEAPRDRLAESATPAELCKLLRAAQAQRDAWPRRCSTSRPRSTPRRSRIP
jgi:hypothetical protein